MMDYPTQASLKILFFIVKRTALHCFLKKSYKLSCEHQVRRLITLSHCNSNWFSLAKKLETMETAGLPKVTKSVYQPLYTYY